MPPGASESALFRHFDAALEDHFLVVYWEQRGTGRSYHGDLPRDAMSTERMLRDLDALVDTVRARFGHDRVVLLGHSWGTILGTLYVQRHPEKVAAYVGVAQIADFADPTQLRPVGATMFIADDLETVDPTARVIGGARELANVSAVEELIAMIAGMRHYESSQRALRSISEAVAQNTNPQG